MVLRCEAVCLGLRRRRRSLLNSSLANRVDWGGGGKGSGYVQRRVEGVDLSHGEGWGVVKWCRDGDVGCSLDVSSLL